MIRHRNLIVLLAGAGIALEIPIHYNEAMQALININVGSPPKQLELLLDTSSAETQLFQAGNSSCRFATHKKNSNLNKKIKQIKMFQNSISNFCMI